MIPLGFLQLVLVAIEGVACALNPKLRRENRRDKVWFGVMYLGILLGGLIILIMVVRELYFQK
jgi:hypothetical protein